MASNGSLWRNWLNRFLKPYIAERLKLLVAEVPEAVAEKAVPKVSPVFTKAASASAAPTKSAVNARLSLAKAQAPSPAMAASSTSTPKKPRSAVTHPSPSIPIRTLNQQAASIPVRSSQTHAKPEAVNGSSAGTTPSRFKRCYYVPVMNPLPDLKDKQLAVLEMRLFGIRDMPTFKDRPPVLPASVINTAKLRDLPLFYLKDMMDNLPPTPKTNEPVQEIYRSEGSTSSSRMEKKAHR